MARPKVHDASTAEQLLDAATTLLRDAGPDAVSVRAVAEACGCSVRAVYALFGSKQALVDALAERGYLTLADRVDAVAHETADLLFHILVGLASRGIPLSDIFSELQLRFGTSGHVEKASRQGE